MKTFQKWLNEAIIAKPVVGTGLAYSPDGNVGLTFINPQGIKGTTSPIIKLTNLNHTDNYGRTQWEVKTANSTYIAAMDPSTAQKLAMTFNQKKSA